MFPIFLIRTQECNNHTNSVPIDKMVARDEFYCTTCKKCFKANHCLRCDMPVCDKAHGVYASGCRHVVYEQIHHKKKESLFKRLLMLITAK